MVKVRVRKAILLIHIVFVFFWIGTIVTMTGLSFLLNRIDIKLMELLYNVALVPVSIISMLTGLVLIIIGKWMLIKHYWILVKLVLTMLLMLTINIWIRIALIISPNHNSLTVGLLLTLLLLSIAVVISYKKPWGRITLTKDV